MHCFYIIPFSVNSVLQQYIDFLQWKYLTNNTPIAKISKMHLITQNMILRWASTPNCLALLNSVKAVEVLGRVWGVESFYLKKQVCTNNDAAFQCNFLFNIFSFYECYLFPLNCALDFQFISLDFAIDFAIFTIWLLM